MNDTDIDSLVVRKSIKIDDLDIEQMNQDSISFEVIEHSKEVIEQFMGCENPPERSMPRKVLHRADVEELATYYESFKAVLDSMPNTEHFSFGMRFRDIGGRLGWSIDVEDVERVNY